MLLYTPNNLLTYKLFINKIFYTFSQNQHVLDFPYESIFQQLRMHNNKLFSQHHYILFSNRATDHFFICVCWVCIHYTTYVSNVQLYILLLFKYSLTYEMYKMLFSHFIINSDSVDNEYLTKTVIQSLWIKVKKFPRDKIKSKVLQNQKKKKRKFFFSIFIFLLHLFVTIFLCILTYTHRHILYTYKISTYYTQFFYFPSHNIIIIISHI